MKTISRTGSAKIRRLATGEPPPDAVTAVSVAGVPNVMEQSLRVGADRGAAPRSRAHAGPRLQPGDRPSVGDARHTDQRAPPWPRSNCDLSGGAEGCYGGGAEGCYGMLSSRTGPPRC